MSSQVENGKNMMDSGDDQQNVYRTQSMVKSKKKKKLGGFFSFRSKKTKTVNNNTVTTEQSDSVSVCSEFSATEDGNYSTTTTYTEEHTATAQSSSVLDAPHQIESHQDYIGDEAVDNMDISENMNGKLEAGLTDADDITITTKETHEASTVSIVESFEGAGESTAEKPSQQLQQEGNATETGTEVQDYSSQKQGKTTKSTPGLDRPSSIRLQPEDRRGLKKSSGRQRQKYFSEQLQNSSTDYISYSASSFRGTRLKSKKVKMSSHATATHHLKVRLLRGQNLAVRDSNGFSDPYVKFKVGQRTVYKSRVCKATLNPEWESEEFTIPVKPSDEICVRVFDKDIASRDDFMGASYFNLASLSEEGETELSLDLEDEGTDEELGQIFVAVTVLPLEDELDGTFDIDSQISPEDCDMMSVSSLKAVSRSDSNASDISRKTVSECRFRKMKAPIRTAVVQLISGKGLPARDANGLSDPYVKLQMGKQKEKSKTCYKTLDPVWKEEFVFPLTGRESLDRERACLDITVWDKDSYRKDDFIGRCELDLGSLERDETRSFNLGLVDAPGSILILATIHQCLPSDDRPTQNDFLDLQDKFALRSTFSALPDVGFAEVKILKASGCRAADIGGKSDPFVVVELCNARAQTHTCYKTLDPVWNKTVTFPIKDIHDVLDFIVYDEDKDQNDFLGRLAIPLLRVVNGVERTYALKDRKLLTRVKGTITVQISFIFNQARAAIRTFSPREEKHMEPDPRFKRQLLQRNFSRIWACLQAVLQTLEFVNSCFTWHNPIRSATAFFVYLLLVWTIDLYMLPILLLLLLAKNYFQVIVQKSKVDRRLSLNPDESFQDDDDDDDDAEDSSNKLSLMRRLKAIEEVLLKVQNILDWIACILERIHNTFTWSVPFLSTLAVIVLSIVVVILYFVPLRVIALLWGINKFTKRLRNPNYVPNNELLDFLSRIPSEVELNQFQELPVLGTSPKNTKKKR